MMGSHAHDPSLPNGTKMGVFGVQFHKVVLFNGRPDDPVDLVRATTDT